ncbi:MAG: hypothetical protein LBD90_08080 [Bifidobacteriaceae bacterium]|nr:hypothetical protein [Bifidobacteriaceae bacterium]
MCISSSFGKVYVVEGSIIPPPAPTPLGSLVLDASIGAVALEHASPAAS